MATQNQVYTAVAGQNQLTAEAAEYYNKVCLDRLLPELMIFKYGQKGLGLPKHSGDTQSWRRWGSLALQTTALQEGVTPDGINASVTKYTSTVKQYGAFIQTTDFFDTVGLDPVLTQLTELIGENAGQSLETIVRDIVAAGTNVMYANSRTSRITVAAGDKITALDILKIRRSFKRNMVKPFENGNYVALVHTDVALDLMSLQEWKDQNTYVNTTNREKGIVGTMYGITFIEYDYALKFAGAGAAAADVYGMLVFGKGGFGIPDIEGSSKPEIIVKQTGSAGTADPLNQRATVGWKALLTAIRLQELAILRYECNATA